MPTIEVRSQVFGGNQDSPSLLPVFLNLLQEHLTVAELIQRTVEEQVRELLLQLLDAQQVHHALERHYLTTEEIVAQAQKGAVRYPSKPSQISQIEVKAEVHRAIRAFEAGSYIILVNGQQVESLDEELTLSMNTKVIFLRLMPLVGG
jgi:hypothetical protein